MNNEYCTYRDPGQRTRRPGKVLRRDVRWSPAVTTRQWPTPYGSPAIWRWVSGCATTKTRATDSFISTAMIRCRPEEDRGEGRQDPEGKTEIPRAWPGMHCSPTRLVIVWVIPPFYIGIDVAGG